MKKRKVNPALIVLTVVFIILGVLFLALLLKNILSPYVCVTGSKVLLNGNSYEEGNQICTCNGGTVVCKEKVSTDPSGVTSEDYTSKNMTFEKRYLSATIPEELNATYLKTRFVSVDTSSKSIKIVLHQVQMCKSDLTLPTQIGLYAFKNNGLTLVNNVNSIESIYTTPCLVEVIYKISGLKIDSNLGFKLQYSSDVGETFAADVCVYGNKVYSNNDKYYSSDKCNVCTCVEGQTVCTDKACTK